MNDRGDYYKVNSMRSNLLVLILGGAPAPPRRQQHRPLSDSATRLDGWALAFALFLPLLPQPLARAATPGSVDLDFRSPGIHGTVWSLASTSSNLFIGGSFTSVEGIARSGLARLTPEGRLDTNFACDIEVFFPQASFFPRITQIIPQDDKLIVVGEFTHVEGAARKGIARLTSVGALDTGFDPGTGASHGVLPGGVDFGTVYTVAPQGDGKMVVGGYFTNFNRIPRFDLARLNSDGSVDSSFNPGSGPDGTVWALALQAAGDVLVGGDFRFFGSYQRSGLAKLSPQGVVDPQFSPRFASILGRSAVVWCLLVDSNGKILVGGDFTQVNEIPRTSIARLNPDGSLDPSFDPGRGADAPVLAIVLQPSKKVLITGVFTNFDGVLRNRVARLNADGSLDTTFKPGSGADDAVHAVALQGPDKAIIGGSFTNFNDTGKARLVRLDASETNPEPELTIAYRTIRSFGFVDTSGEAPVALVESSDGYLYGTTDFGGLSNVGVLFRLSKDGHDYRILYHFSVANGNGHFPGRFVEGPDGALYGPGQYGGINQAGTLLRVTKDGSQVSVLHKFAGPPEDGFRPLNLVADRDGNFFGVTAQGGTNDAGTVFTVGGDGGGYSIIHHFATNAIDGRQPIDTLVESTDGMLYGLTVLGGTNGGGTIFTVRTNGTNYRILEHFSQKAGDPAFNSLAFRDAGILLEGQDGVLYGCSSHGGTNNYGTLFKIRKDGSSFSIIANFSESMGLSPDSILEGKDGRLYGSTCCSDNGNIFSVNKNGTDFRVLREFSVGTISSPAGLFEARDGDIYGVAEGGKGGAGAVFLLNPTAGSLAVVRDFLALGGDARAAVDLMQARDGRIYGTATQGGTNDAGAIFRLERDGSDYELICQFPRGNGPIANPISRLVEGSGGGLYGISAGPYNSGLNVYRFTPETGAIAVILSLTNSIPPVFSITPFLLGSDQMLYGALPSGGQDGGIIFRLKQDGTSYQVLKQFPTFGMSDASDSGYSPGELIQAADAALYGTTRFGGAAGHGRIFRLRADGSGFTVLHFFAEDTAGAEGASARLLDGRDGFLYGTTFSYGSIFRVSTNGDNFSTLKVFEFDSEKTQGVAPVGSLVDGPDGRLYGVTSRGGNNGTGTIFRLEKDGSGFRTLRSFPPSGSSNQGRSFGGLLLARGNTVYGVTQEYSSAGGTIFSFSFQPLGPWLLNPSLLNGSFSVAIETQAGKRYTLEKTSSILNPASWIPIKTVEGNDEAVSFTDASVPGNQAFYRVRIE